jgi:hypothetical protein
MFQLMEIEKEGYVIVGVSVCMCDSGACLYISSWSKAGVDPDPKYDADPYPETDADPHLAIDANPGDLEEDST